MKRQFGLIVLCLSLLGGPNYAMAKEAYQLVVKRSERVMVLEKNGLELKRYHIAFGSGKGAKQVSGDKRTPIGKYRITEIRPSDKFHLFMQLNYPNVQDAMNGLRSKRLTQAEYRRILDAHIYHRLPPQHTKLGGSIGIHGIGVETEEKIDIHEVANWTQGCVAVRNKEIVELSRYVRAGTVVIIEE